MAEGYTVAELLAKVAFRAGLTPDADIIDDRIYQAITAAGRTAATWPGTDWWWLYSQGGSFIPLSKTVATVANKGAVRASNVVTILTTATHGVVVGQRIRIDGVTDSTMDGAFDVVAIDASTKTFTYANVGDASTSGAGSVYSNEYILRTVNSSNLSAIRDVIRIYYDDEHPLKQISFAEYSSKSALSMKIELGTPTEYAISEGIVGPILHLLPTPDEETRMFVDFKRFHKKLKIDTTSANLIVPMEFQEGVYVDGATWLLRSEVAGASSLKECPGFMEAIDRMSGAEPTDADGNPDDKYDEPGVSHGPWPNNKKVMGCMVLSGESVD